jgi:phage baseplate assembly protein W
MDNSLKIVFGEEVSENQKAEAVHRLGKLFSTPKGTMPMNRGYGVDFSDTVDTPPPVARNTFVVAAAEAVEEYEPEFDVDSIDFDVNDSETGQLRNVVTLVPSSDDEE